MKESTMKTAKHLSILISAIVILSTLSSPAHARFKCWTNNEGIKECGEKVPPEYAQKGHQEMSTQGMVLEKKDRAKNKQELAEEARQAELAATQQKIKGSQGQIDTIIADMVTTKQEVARKRGSFRVHSRHSIHDKPTNKVIIDDTNIEKHQARLSLERLTLAKLEKCLFPILPKPTINNLYLDNSLGTFFPPK